MITAGNLTRRNFPTCTATRCHGPVRWYFAFCDGLDARVDVARSVDMLVQRGPPYHGEMSKVPPHRIRSPRLGLPVLRRLQNALPHRLVHFQSRRAPDPTRQRPHGSLPGCADEPAQYAGCQRSDGNLLPEERWFREC